MTRKTKFGLITPGRWAYDPPASEAYAMGFADGMADRFVPERYNVTPRRVANAYRAGKLAGEQMRLSLPAGASQGD